MRIVLIGCVQSSEYFLNLLISHGYSPVGVVTKSDSAVNSDFVDLMPICEEFNIPCIHVSNANDAESAAFIRQCEPDLIYCFGWSQLIKRPVLEIPKIGSVGFHPAKLPNNRGRHPLIWVLALGLPETASSFFMMDEQADTGAIISQETVPIAYEDTASTLYDKILQVAGQQVLSFTRDFAHGTVRFHAQPNAGNAWRKRSVQDGKIDWRMSGRAIYNLVRALTRPYPGAFFTKDGNPVSVWKVEELPMDGVENIECGKVLSVKSSSDFYVKAYDAVIHILECTPVILEEGEYLL